MFKAINSSISFKSFSEYLLIAGGIIGQGIAYNKLYLFHLGILLTLPYLVRSISLRSLQSKKVFFVLGAMHLWILVSCLWAPSFKSGFYDFLRALIVIYPVIYISCMSPKVEIIRNSLIGCFIANLAISLLEGITTFRYPFSKYSTIADAFYRNHYDWAPVLSDSSFATGFSWGPNMNGFFILILFPLILRFVPRFRYRMAIFALSTAAIFFTSSRSAMGGWLILMMLMSTRKVMGSEYKKFLGAFVVVALLVIPSYLFVAKAEVPNKIRRIPNIPTSFIVALKGGFDDESLQEARMLSPSLADRMELIKRVLTIFRSNPFVGVGAGGLHGQVELQNHEKNTLKVSVESPHFFILELLAKYGIFYGVLVFYLAVLLVKQLVISREIFALISLTFCILFNFGLSSISYYTPAWIAIAYYFSFTPILRLEHSQTG